MRIRTARELRLENEKAHIEMDEKDLEIERLKADNLLALDVASKFADERDELKAELARLRVCYEDGEKYAEKLEAELAQAKGETELLKYQLSKQTPECERIQAELKQAKEVVLRESGRKMKAWKERDEAREKLARANMRHADGGET